MRGRDKIFPSLILHSSFVASGTHPGQLISVVQTMNCTIRWIALSIVSTTGARLKGIFVKNQEVGPQGREVAWKEVSQAGGF